MHKTLVEVGDSLRRDGSKPTDFISIRYSLKVAVFGSCCQMTITRVIMVNYSYARRLASSHTQ